MYRQAEITDVGRPFRLVTSSTPVATSGCVRIKLAYSGVCHSDVHISDDSKGIRKKFEGKFEGMVLGHEISGYIEQEGEGVKLAEYDLSVGDPVMVYPWLGCQNCSTCQTGHSNVCPDPMANILNIGCGPFSPGGYRTHMIVKPQHLVKVPSSISMEVACMLPCSAGTSYASLLKLQEAMEFGKKTSGKARLLIIGCGGLGLWAIQLASVMFGDKVHIIAADVEQSKLELAKSTGAHETVLWDTSASAETNAAVTTKNGLINGAIDFCGSPVTSLTAVKSLIRHGTLVLIGLRGGTLPTDIVEVIIKALTIRGNYTLSIGQLRDLVKLVDDHKITYPSLSYYDLDEVYDILQKLRHGHINGRAIIKHHV